MAGIDHYWRLLSLVRAWMPPGLTDELGFDPRTLKFPIDSPLPAEYSAVTELCPRTKVLNACRGGMVCFKRRSS